MTPRSDLIVGGYGPLLLVDRVERYMLSSGRHESAETRESRRCSLRRMAALGFRLEVFAQGQKEAKAEGDAFLGMIALAWEQAERVRVQRGLPKGRRKTSGRANYVRVLHMLRDCFEYEEGKVKWLPGRISKPGLDVLTLDELIKVIRAVPFKRKSEVNSRKRFLRDICLVTGRRPDELQRFEDTDLFPEQSAVRVMVGAKGNANKALVEVEKEFFSPNKAAMSWVRKRPVAKSNPRALFVKTDKRGVVRVMTKGEIQKELGEIGKEAGVRFNATRARHTRIAAWFAQGRTFPWVKRAINHGRVETLAAYVEFTDAGLAEHLAKPTWFRNTQSRATWQASRDRKKEN